MLPLSIEIFKTNVNHPKDAEAALAELSRIFPNSQINFDLEDCDKVLRIEGNDLDIAKVMATLDKLGFSCHCLN